MTANRSACFTPIAPPIHDSSAGMSHDSGLSEVVLFFLPGKYRSKWSNHLQGFFNLKELDFAEIVITEIIRSQKTLFFFQIYRQYA